jgi:hypothetical protein
MITCETCGKIFKKQGFLEKHKETCNDLTCEFCKKQFKQQVRFFNHMCEQKRRHIERDDKHVKLGYMSYKHYISRTNRLNMNVPTYENFSNSSLYKEFVDFGRHLIRINAINPIGFVDFLIKMQTPLKKWMATTTYEIYIRELNKTETPIQALERNILLMQQWSMETGEDWTDFFRKISTTHAVLWIKSGRISPWLLFSASSASALMSRMNSEQLEIVNQAIDTNFWEHKLKRHQEDMKNIQEELSRAGI